MKTIKPGYVYLTKLHSNDNNGQTVVPCVCINVNLPLVQVVPLSKTKIKEHTVKVTTEQGSVSVDAYAQCYDISSVPIQWVGREVGDIKVQQFVDIKQTLEEVLAL